ncbi:hypothetical protein TWF481_000125 [Arthrobotrys musiformis]|uniref:Velvet domain-containing protein n=1 Tax=Arthrobotrys musiformis TaxID=47236 RepID=A0AAV9WMK6_9PEZI
MATYTHEPFGPAPYQRSATLLLPSSLGQKPPRRPRAKVQIRSDPTIPPFPYKLIIIRNDGPDQTDWTNAHVSTFDLCEEPVQQSNRPSSVFQLLSCAAGTLRFIESVIESVNEAPEVRSSAYRYCLHSLDTGAWVNSLLICQALVLKLGKSEVLEDTDSDAGPVTPATKSDAPSPIEYQAPTPLPGYSRRRVGPETDPSSALYGGD